MTILIIVVGLYLPLRLALGRLMKILITCERSGAVREAFRARGHDAWSCDLAPAEDNSPFHIIGDAIAAATQTWDMIGAHPPCTRLANSGVLRLYRAGKKINGIDPIKWEEMLAGAAFFAKFVLMKAAKKYIENPIIHSHAKTEIERICGPLPTPQIIQPFAFGHPESKSTCLWLWNLPPLQKSTVQEQDFFLETLAKPEKGHWENQTASGQNKLPPSKTRAIDRARTYSGIAHAMATQWG